MGPFCIAETDAEARKLFEEHIWFFAHRLLDGVQLTPPGYMSARSAAAMQAAVGTFMNSVQTWDDLIEGYQLRGLELHLG